MKKLTFLKKRVCLFTAAMLLAGTSFSQWAVYNGDVLPSTTGSAALDLSSESSANSGPVDIKEIASAMEYATSSVLKIGQPVDTALDGSTAKYMVRSFMEGNDGDFTLVFRMKALTDSTVYDRICDIQIRNGAAGVRDEFRVSPADSIIELSKGTSKSVKVNMNFEEWHTFRFGVDGDSISVYIDEMVEPVLTKTMDNSTGDDYFKFGDETGDIVGGLIDFIALDSSNAYAPGTGTMLPGELYVDGRMNEVPVPDGGDIQAYMGAVKPGETLILDGTYSPGTLSLNQNDVTIKAADDAEEMPTLDIKEIQIDSVDNALVLDGLNIVGNNSYLIYFVQTFDYAKYVKILNCKVSNLERSMFRGDKTPSNGSTYTCDSLIVDNTVVTNVGVVNGGYQTFLAKSSFVTEFVSVTNSTFYNCDGGFMRFHNTDVAREIIIDGCTLHKVMYNTGKKLFEIDGAAGSSLSISNTIISGLPTLTYWDLSGVDVMTIDNSNYWDIEDATSFEAFPGTITASLNVDPMYADTTNGDLTVFRRVSELLTASSTGGPIGDPRWYPEVVEVPEDLAALYRFEDMDYDTILDEVMFSDGNVIDTLEFIEGPIGSAITFNGVDPSDRIVVPHTDSLDFNGSFTISGVINSNDISGSDQFFFYKGHNSDGAEFTSAGESYTSKGLWVALGFKEGKLRFFADDNSANLNFGIDVSNRAVEGEWIHVVGVRDSLENVMRLYLNGQLLDTVIDARSTQLSDSLPLFIGNHAANDNQFVGAIDEIAVYRKALSSEEIMDMATGYGLNVFPKKTIAKLDSVAINGVALDSEFLNGLLIAGTLPIPVLSEGIPQVEAFATDADANVEITQATAFPGTATIKITAEDGETSVTYNLILSPISTDATLEALSVSVGSLDPVFSSEITAYTVTVADDVTSLDISATPTSDAASVVGDSSITLENAQTVINVIVTAEDKETSITYVVTIDKIVSNVNTTLNNTLVYFTANDLVINSDATINKVEVFDLTGKVVLSKTMNASSTVMNVDNLQSSAYIVRISSNDNQVESFKLVK